MDRVRILARRPLQRRQPMVPMRADLMALFDRDELAKYYTPEELPPADPAPAEETN